jgi:hypothetical protein
MSESGRVTPTKIRHLLLLAVLAGVLGWGFARRFYPDVPPPSLVPVILFVLALGAAATGWATRNRVHRRPDTKPIDPIGVARTLALAKASSLVGALSLGYWSGMAVYLWGKRSYYVVAKHDSVVAILGGAASLALVAAALWLEYACRTPDKPDQTENRS